MGEFASHAIISDNKMRLIAKKCMSDRWFVMNEEEKVYEANVALLNLAFLEM